MRIRTSGRSLRIPKALSPPADLEELAAGYIPKSKIKQDTQPAVDSKLFSLMISPLTGTNLRVHPSVNAYGSHLHLLYFRIYRCQAIFARMWTILIRVFARGLTKKRMPPSLAAELPWIGRLLTASMKLPELGTWRPPAGLPTRSDPDAPQPRTEGRRRSYASQGHKA